MYSEAMHSYSNYTPPRRGACFALGVDVTARPYDLTQVDFGGFVVGEKKTRQRCFLELTALTADVWIYFDTATSNDLNPAAVLAPGSALTYVTTQGMRIAAGTTVRWRIDRQQDKFMIAMTLAGTATLLFRASSESFGD